ncbi:biopolymer transporter ExbD [Vogesella sp. LIG4]|uniref:ExbD/TolR family protein n=1 Tax=Vogesella sp. LIG4 TaxID=1192162 RepID=UPI00081F9586|nr:biopolymer transporter ExbD [Vogesella sp. LIG4]SCK06323.1 biopolymer transport protein ExbD [Vogesella sp. LIG4]
MNFRRHGQREEPEINFIPLIDLLLVILIFLMVTTTYSHYSELQVNLPQAEGKADDQKNSPLRVEVSRHGDYRVNGQAPAAPNVTALTELLKSQAAGKTQPVVIISADAESTHQSVVTVMEAARFAGLSQLTFATQMGPK